MSIKDTTGNKPHDSTDLEKRDIRALTQYLTVIPDAPGMYRVVSQSGKSYTVDSREGRCTCPDHEYRGVRCKHQRRVAFATGERPIPASIDRTEIDEHLGRHVDETPRMTATDGGVIDASGKGEIHNESDGRPDECQCWNPDAELPCFPCYREGFRSQNPEAPVEEE